MNWPDMEASVYMDEEQNVWEGHSSHFINLPVYLLCALAVGALLGGSFFLAPPLSFAVAAPPPSPGGCIVQVAITNAAAIKSPPNACGSVAAFSKTDEVELYQVKDYVLVEPFG
jgi:hypothetical protein